MTPPKSASPGQVASAAWLLTMALLVAAQLAPVARPLLLAERFLPGSGFIEAAALATYAAWLTFGLHDVKRVGRWRRRLWGLFSVVFFAQLALGLAGFEQFLMSGTLHLPIPALIVGGPLYRGDGFFMPILLLVTVCLVGPAWCSYLCYMGAWDSALAFSRRKLTLAPRRLLWLQLGMLALVVGTAVTLRVAGASGLVAASFGLAFGIIGVGIMLVSSRQRGLMIHCVGYCPIGIVTTVLGKLSPFRLRIAAGCDACGACTFACRYNALHAEDIARGRPALSCTLCGDCLRACSGRFLEYRFWRLHPLHARQLFLVLVISLHALFLGVARI